MTGGVGCAVFHVFELLGEFRRFAMLGKTHEGGSTCPWCERYRPLSTGIGVDHAPRPGDVTVCSCCAGVAEITESGERAKVDLLELLATAPLPSAVGLVVAIQAAWEMRESECKNYARNMAQYEAERNVAKADPERH